MILIDSSVWIAYYRPGGSAGLKDMIIEAITSDRVAVNGMIMVEILSGISKKDEFNMVKSDLKGYHFLPFSEEDAIEASLLGSSLRKNGVTIPSTDLIIATSAMKSGRTLYHLDRHFDRIAEQVPSFKARNLGDL